jgi:CheY-like chemotaxis protein
VSHTLLLADDSITIQRVIELTFADEDIRVVAVSDGHEAIARIEETPPDIVLADVEMPGTDGYEVARHIRRTPKLAHIPVLLLTGAFEPVDQAKVADVGCQGVLTKPFEPQLVIQRVRELLAGTAPQTASTGPDTSDRRTPALAGDEPRPPAARSISVDDYFEQLDAAFATLPGGSGARPRQQPPRLPPAGPPPPATLPGISLADAFAALLAAEQAGSAAASRPAGRPSAPGAEAGRDLIADALVNEVVRRVLERLADPMVRETVSDVVLDVAERLVREEIERIKGSVR